MIGRYGTDQLNMAILIFGMVITFIGDIFSSSILMLITYVIFGTCVFRILSKDIPARQKENAKFLELWNPINAWIKIRYEIIKNYKTYKYFKCPNCKKMLRAPKGKGKIAITCQNCKTKFNKET
jgi:hypothetical protein